MKLFIAEKPSLARAIADALPKPHRKADGCIYVSNGDVVTWCIGHLLEQVAPEVYDQKYKKWLIADLPIIPTKWQLAPKSQTKKQLSVIKKLIKQADIIINAGDADREGQILVDEVINYCGASKTKIANAQRCLISDMNLSAVKKAISNLKANKDYVSLAVSALARARADWLYGLNMTRLCTLQGQKSGYQGVLSIGRVQTPILGLIVNRDIEIKHFVSKPFYEVIANICTKQGVNYQGKWKPSVACEPYMDDENRIISKPLALNVIQRIQGKPGKIVNYSEQKKKQTAPLLFSLSALQISANKVFNMSAKQTLDICQQLYEKHKLITYPRSDCQYLPLAHFKEVSSVTGAISQISPKSALLLKDADLTLKSRVWNNSKVGAHHAIIPTSRNKISGSLTANEEKVYELIARQYIAQFYPAFEYLDKQIDTEIEQGLFISKQKDIINQGWKVLFTTSVKNKQDNEFSSNNLPRVSIGEQVDCINGELLEKNTTPPKHFTEATLLSALTGISRFVTDKEIKKILKDSDGLGTEATRAGIIELLFKREYVFKKGKDIYATEVGTQLISALPGQISQPDMTALWESQLESIYNKSLSYQSFITGVQGNLQALINEVKEIQFTGLPQTTKKKTFRRKTRSVKK